MESCLQEAMHVRWKDRGTGFSILAAPLRIRRTAGYLARFIFIAQSQQPVVTYSGTCYFQLQVQGRYFFIAVVVAL